MKKACILAACLVMALVGAKVMANPVYIPDAYVSELIFDEEGAWTIELFYTRPAVDTIIGPLDSICLISGSDTAWLSHELMTEPWGYVVLKQEQLRTPLNINRKGDTVTVAYGDWLTNSYLLDYTTLIFGNCPGAMISAPQLGQSLCYYYMGYVKDASPTLGFQNDFQGIYGTLQGVIYDKNHRPVPGLTFSLDRWDTFFPSNEQGEYTVQVLAKRHSYVDMVVFVANDPTFRDIEILSFEIEPDSLLTMNIYLKDSLVGGISRPVVPDLPFSVLPNPASVNGMATVLIDLPMTASAMVLTLVDGEGKQLWSKRIISKEVLFEVPEREGFYLLTVSMDGVRLATSKLLVKP